MNLLRLAVYTATLLSLPLFSQITAQGQFSTLNQVTGNTPTGEFRSDRILIKPKLNSSQADISNLNQRFGAKAIRVFTTLGKLQVLQLPPGAKAMDVIAAYKRSGLIEYAEPDYIVRVRAMSNDPRLRDGVLWGLNNIGQQGGAMDADMDVPEGWEVQQSASNVVIAVIDTGVRATHEDLAANMWVNPNEIPNNGRDDDANGYIDDVHGINTIDSSGNPNDDNGHGTHTAGTIGGVGNNGKGIAGIAWHTKIMACKFLNSRGSGSTSDAIACIDYARRMGAHIMSNSWGGSGYSQSLHDALHNARNFGILIVAAAGNEARNNDTSPSYPASYELDNIISVASTDRKDVLSSFSNYGASSVDVAAPGSDIYSTYYRSDSDYTTLSGTSMATPQVSGVLALLKARYPLENYLQLKSRLFNSVDRLPSLSGRVATGGRVNLSRSLDRGPLPTISSFTPTSGVVGTSVTIYGTSLANSTAVLFNGVAASFTVNSVSQMTATVPPGATTGLISVANSVGTVNSVNSFTVIIPPPSISSFFPNQGSRGSFVTIYGTDFVNVTSVKFNGVPSRFVVLSPGQIVARVPFGRTGSIWVTTSTGTATSNAIFSFH